MRMKMRWLILLPFLLVQSCSGFDLTDEEHDRLPQVFSLENYDKCIRYNGTYCLLGLELYAEEGNEFMAFIRNYSQNHHVKHFNYSFLERGVCISTTCKEFIGDLDLDDPAQRHQVVQACSNHSVWSEHGLFANVTMELCEKQSEGIDIDQADWVVLGVILAVLALNLVATAYDMYVTAEEKKKFGKGRKMLMCFSIIGNYNYLVSAGSPGHSDSKHGALKGINAIRNGGSISVIFGHAALVLFGGFIDNPHDLEKGFHSPLFELTINGTFVVQIFFVIASFLLVYNLEVASETKKITWWSVPKVLLFRFWRLTPPLALLVAFTATWMRHLGSGPLWSRNVLSLVHDCRQYWWTHLLYINNYWQENRFCAIHTWHLAADTQLFVLALVVYVLTKKGGRNEVLTSLLILGIILPPLSVLLYDLDLTFTFSPEMSRHLGDENFWRNFALGHTNIVGYIIGMYTGYKLYEWNNKGIAIKSKKLVVIIRLLCTAALFAMPSIITFLNTDDVSLPVRMGYQAVFRVFVCSVVAILIMTLTTKFNNSLLDWNIWVFLGKISYSVFLVHLNILHFIVGIRTQLDHLHFFTFVMVEFGFYVLSCGIAIPFYILVEAPLTPLLKILMSPSEKKNLGEVPEKKNLGEVPVNSKNEASVVNDTSEEKIKSL